MVYELNSCLCDSVLVILCYASHVELSDNLQEERLKRLKHRTKVYFDASRPDHQVSFHALKFILQLRFGTS